MKKVYIRVLDAVAFVSFAVACNSPQPEPLPEPSGAVIDEDKVTAFVETEDYGVYDSDLADVFVFDKFQHEMVYNTKASRFVIQDNYQKALLSVTLTLSEEPSHYSVSVSSSQEGVALGTYTMKMVKSENDMAWLWDVENRLGIIALIYN